MATSGTAGSPSIDVVTVQGPPSGGTAVPVLLTAGQPVLSITGSVYAIPVPDGSSGATPLHLVAVGGTNATSVKASAGTVYGVQVSNRHATADRFVKCYNKASAPTVGTDTPVKVLRVAAGQDRDITWPTGVQFTAGIALAITGGYADADATAVTAGDVVLGVDYK